MKERMLSRMVLYRIEKPEMAAAMQMSVKTFYRRLAHPDEFSLGELRIAAKKLKTTVGALAEGL